MVKKILTIAGSDSSAGAGIQADLKTIMVLNAYGSSVITAVTAQNTLGVNETFLLPVEIVKQQFTAVMDDLGADTIKIGMVANQYILEAIIELLNQYKTQGKYQHLVLDPVFFAKGGASLFDGNHIDYMIAELFPLATIITPNIPELEILVGEKVQNLDDMVAMGNLLLKKCAHKNLLIKGGHIHGNIIYDVLLNKGDVHIFDSYRIESKNTHGTGCTLSSAIAVFLAQGETIYQAVVKARKYVNGAIKNTIEGIGHGHGPVNHSYLYKN